MVSMIMVFMIVVGVLIVRQTIFGVIAEIDLTDETCAQNVVAVVVVTLLLVEKKIVRLFVESEVAAILRDVVGQIFRLKIESKGIKMNSLRHSVNRIFSEKRGWRFPGSLRGLNIFHLLLI